MFIHATVCVGCVYDVCYMCGVHMFVCGVCGMCVVPMACMWHVVCVCAVGVCVGVCGWDLFMCGMCVCMVSAVCVFSGCRVLWFRFHEHGVWLRDPFKGPCSSHIPSAFMWSQTAPCKEWKSGLDRKMS